MFTASSKGHSFSAIMRKIQIAYTKQKNRKALSNILISGKIVEMLSSKSLEEKIMLLGPQARIIVDDLHLASEI